MKGKFLLIAALSAMVCSCQGGQQTKKDSQMKQDENFEQRRQEMHKQSKPQQGGCCSTEKTTESKQTANTAEVKVEKPQ